MTGSSNTKLALVGYGKMGRMIERLAPEHGFEICSRLDSKSNSGSSGLTKENLQGARVAIEFTTPAVAARNIEQLAAAGVNIVSGTTGWHDSLPQVRAAVEKAGVGLVWARNFSIGVNLFSELVEEAARLFAPHSEYGAWAWEIHHAAKKDAPSGTLLQLMEEMKRAGFLRPISASSSRAGMHPGTHEIGFDSAVDTITLRHTARSREGFAAGALAAARWIIGRRGVYEFKDALFGSSAAEAQAR
jgi:4-hydroxy-tetrahydrodipicolinate reductase